MTPSLVEFAPYSQRYGGPRLNSLAQACISQDLEPKVGFAIDLAGLKPRYAGDKIEWVLLPEKAELALTVSVDAALWVNLRTHQVLSDVPLDTMEFIGILPNGRYLRAPRAGELFFWLQGERPRGARRDAVVDEALEAKLEAFVFIGNDVIVAYQNFPNLGAPRRHEVRVSRTPVTKEYTPATWEHIHKNVDAFPYPVLSDGTIVVCLPDSLHYYRPDGSEPPPVSVKLLPRLVSSDQRDTVWGFEELSGGLHLVSFSLGTKVAMLLPVSGTPNQPPVTLPDGRVIVVMTSELLCVERGQVTWRHKLTSSQGMVTGTLDGQILVRAGSVLSLLDRRGKELWSVRAPNGDEITSNAAVTADGNVCFATFGKRTRSADHVPI